MIFSSLLLTARSVADHIKVPELPEQQKLEDVITTFVEKTVELCGITGPSVHVARHILLILVTVLLAWLSNFLCVRIFVPMVGKITARTKNKWDDVLFNARVMRAACHIVPAIVVWQLLPMVFYQYPVVREILTRVTAIYITVMSMKLVLTFVNSFKLFDPAHRTSTQQYIQTLCGVIKIIAVFLCVIVVVAILINKSPFKLLAGLGATSAIMMLVFKDTIVGLVSGIRLTNNNMVHKGDWITVPQASADGVVEEITLTTVKIRNFDNTIVTLSPQTLVEQPFQNWKGMQQSGGRRVKRLVYFDFRHIRVATDELKQQLVDKHYFNSTNDVKGCLTNMSLFRKYVELYLGDNPLVNGQLIYMVRQLEATNCGLPLQFYFFLNDKELKPYEHALADIMEYIYAIAPDFELVIYQQYPEQ